MVKCHGGLAVLRWVCGHGYSHTPAVADDERLAACLRSVIPMCLRASKWHRACPGDGRSAVARVEARRDVPSVAAAYNVYRRRRMGEGVMKWSWNVGRLAGITV